MPLYIASIDLILVFNCVSRGSSIKLLKPVKLLSVIYSLHVNMRDKVNYDETTLQTVEICSSVKQSYVLVTIHLGILFPVMQSCLQLIRRGYVFTYNWSDAAQPCQPKERHKFTGLLLGS